MTAVILTASVTKDQSLKVVSNLISNLEADLSQVKSNKVDKFSCVCIFLEN